MLQFDLSNTPACMRGDACPPTEGELLAVQVALMLIKDCCCKDLDRLSLELSESNRRQVEQVLTKSLKPLSRDLIGESVSVRLAELTGLRITRG